MREWESVVGGFLYPSRHRSAVFRDVPSKFKSWTLHRPYGRDRPLLLVFSLESIQCRPAEQKPLSLNPVAVRQKTTANVIAHQNTTLSQNLSPTYVASGQQKRLLGDPYSMSCGSECAISRANCSPGQSQPMNKELVPNIFSSPEIATAAATQDATSDSGSTMMIQIALLAIAPKRKPLE